MFGIGRAAGDLNAEVCFDEIEVLDEVQIRIVGRQALGIAAEVEIGAFETSET